jgi:transcription antitermination factor NusG
MASINGATQIRAGVIRPEIIIPLDGEYKIEEKSAELFGMDKGTEVRVIRAPYFGMLGEVTELPHELQRLESGSLARVAKVRLYESKKEVLLPRANLEMIEKK